MIISVVIAAYNEGKYISRALASLGKQQLDHGDNLEIIVIDDGSNDDTSTKVKKYSSVKLLHQDHKGAALSRNLGVKYARGEIVVLVDADMEFELNFVRNLIQPIKDNKTKGTFSRREFVANWKNWVARCWNWDNNLPAQMRLPADASALGSDFRAILKSEFLRVNGFDDIGYNDSWTLAKKLGYQPIDAKDAIFYHHNVSSLSEAYNHAKWVSKRKYKLGNWGKVVALSRVSLPVSIVIGFYKSILHLEPGFLVYKIVWDLGLTFGMIDMWISGKTSK